MDTSIDHSQNTQTTQPVSQSQPRPEEESNAEYWGVLLPCSAGLERVRFPKSKPTVTIGRDAEHTMVLPWTAISVHHAKIEWNEQEDGQTCFTITDSSFNGTFINKELIGKGKSRILSDGSDICFGPIRTSSNSRKPEYRYTFRDLVSEKRQVFRKYDLSNELGNGTYSRVFKALQIGTSRWVAVKYITQTMRFNLTPAAEADAIREISIMKTLHHPNVCSFLEYFENPNRSLDIVLEYVDGGDLAKYMAQTGGAGIGEWMSCHLTYQVCQAVSYIHSCHITHRDLKPENILLTRDTPPIVKIADFGLAKLLHEQTALRTIVGTRSYMAPEVLNRMSTDKPYSNRVDSWSIGAIVFAMFTMQTPFPRLPTQNLKQAVADELVEWIHLDLRTEISENGKDFVHQLLIFNQDHRMAISAAHLHPWLVGHRPTYEMQNPDDYEAGETSTRAPSPNSASGSSSTHRSIPRAPTADPYGDDYGILQTGPDPHTPPLQPLAEHIPLSRVASRPPGLRQVPTESTPPDSPQRLLRGRAGATLNVPSNQFMRNSTDERIYGPATTRTPVRQPTLIVDEDAPQGGGHGQKRTRQEMIDGSSPLTSLASLSSLPPPKKKTNKGGGRTTKRATNGAGAKGKAKADAPATPRPRKGRTTKKQHEESEEEQAPAPAPVPALRRSTRPARQAKR
ncbi:Pkinase-domain-containing protein [Favolaschia claudopus]|uniref:Pkinase-domain-containing protein n=1 Tax=Favolaschia claudopus TaxID=2862362 RepID=A0AAW0AZM9_9AGAR